MISVRIKPKEVIRTGGVNKYRVNNYCDHSNALNASKFKGFFMLGPRGEV